MTPERAADIAARAYQHMAPWRAEDIAAMLRRPHTILSASEHAFVLGQVIADEAEIFALAADPDHHRTGQASIAFAHFLSDAAARGATQVFLEVSAENAPAIAFYEAKGFIRAGVRRGYYRSPHEKAVDAVVMRLDLP
ncbi:GNAT family N-acetyltransferase [Primorskyibacter sp. 2E107]|uniref:GNAT family N-acetyltransferase n=1 Tax=Primorskyibacter sp. 2E107 TaxID=3403458 RepID=UPI003AF9C270